jgi:beta-galactosidase
MGKVEGDQVSFQVENNTFKGSIKGDTIQLQRSVNLGWEIPKPPKKAPDAPDIGPAPDGSDPSTGNFDIPSSIPMVLRRAER